MIKDEENKFPREEMVEIRNKKWNSVEIVQIL